MRIFGQRLLLRDSYLQYFCQFSNLNPGKGNWRFPGQLLVLFLVDQWLEQRCASLFDDTFLSVGLNGFALHVLTCTFPILFEAYCIMSIAALL